MKENTGCEKLSEYIIDNKDRFYRIAFYYVHNSDDAMDIVSESILKAYEAYGKLGNPDKIKTWFYRILVNSCMDYFRKQKKESPAESDYILEEAFEEKAYDAELISIYKMVESLPEKIRTVIILRYYEECSIEEIAKITGSGIGAVKYRLYTGIERLKKLYGDE